MCNLDVLEVFKFFMRFEEKQKKTYSRKVVQFILNCYNKSDRKVSLMYKNQHFIDYFSFLDSSILYFHPPESFLIIPKKNVYINILIRRIISLTILLNFFFSFVCSSACVQLRLFSLIIFITSPSHVFPGPPFLFHINFLCFLMFSDLPDFI